MLVLGYTGQDLELIALLELGLPHHEEGSFKGLTSLSVVPGLCLFSSMAVWAS